MQQLEAYLSTLRPNSRAPYRQAFYEFQKFLKERELWVNQLGLDTYMSWLKDKKLSGNTIRLKFEALAAIYNSLHKRGCIKTNPFVKDKIRLPRRNWNRKRHYKMIPFDKVMKICDGPTSYTKNGIEQRAILALLFGGGLRKQELLNLKIGDVRTSEHGTTYLYLRETKAQQDAEQALPTWAIDRLEKHLYVRKLDGGKAKDPLFTGHTAADIARPGSLTIRTFDRMFKRCCEHAGIRNVSPHCSRVTAISKLFHDRVDQLQVRDFARHASLTTTERYDARSFGIENSAGKKLQY